MSDTTNSPSTDPAQSSDVITPETGKVTELVRGITFAMLTTVDTDGSFVSRPMAHQDVEFDGDLWFVSARDSRKVRQIEADPHVGVTLASADTWVSVNGSARVVDDQDKLEQVWSAQLDAWFPQGPDDSVALIKVSGETAEYWDSPGGRIATVLSLVKAKVTGERYDGGDNDVVDLKPAG